VNERAEAGIEATGRVEAATRASAADVEAGWARVAVSAKHCRTVIDGDAAER